MYMSVNLSKGKNYIYYYVLLTIQSTYIHTCDLCGEWGDAPPPEVQN